MSTIKINPKEWEFEFQQRNEQPILPADLMGRGFYYGLKKEMKLPKIPLTDFLFTASSKGYVKKKQGKIIIDSLRKAINRRVYLRYIFDTTKKRVYELDNFVKYSIKKIKDPNISSEDLARLWEEFDKIFLDVYPWFCIPWYVTEENMLSDKVKEGLRKHGNEVRKITDLNNALLILLFPTTPFLIQKEQAHFYKLAKFAKSHKNFEKNNKFIISANSYLQKYSWINTFFLLPIEPLSFRALAFRIKKAIKEGFVEQYALQQKIAKENKKLAHSLIQKLNYDKEVLKWIEWSRRYGWLLNWSVEQALISFVKFQSFMKLVAKRINVPYKDLIHLTSKEIIGGLIRRRKFTRREINQRKQGYVFVIERGKTKLFYGKKAKELSDKLDETIDPIEVQKITEIKGQPASPGRATGRVCRAMTANVAGKVKGGDILLCVMTSPDYVPAMNRSSAVVTDEGGLLCHAAIVSRELGKPCIVGTKFATKVLKNGDLVEVDANNGVVRIIKRIKV